MDQENIILETVSSGFILSTNSVYSNRELMCSRELLSLLKLESKNRSRRVKTVPSLLNDPRDFHVGKMRLEQLKNLVNAFVQIVSSAVTTESTESEDSKCLDMLDCSYCYGRIFEPVTLPCGSTFCRQCFRKEVLNPCKFCKKLHSTSFQESQQFRVTTMIANLIEKLFPEETKASELRKEGNSYIVEYNYEEAVKKYSEGLLHAPKDHVIYSNRSYAYAALKNYEQALLDSEKACSFRPTWPKAHFRKGSMLLKMNRIEEAMESFVNCIQLDKNVSQQICQEINRFLDYTFQSECPTSSHSQASSVKHILLAEAMIGKIQTALNTFISPNTPCQNDENVKLSSPNSNTPNADVDEISSASEIKSEITSVEKNEVLSNNVVEETEDNSTNSVLAISADTDSTKHSLTSSVSRNNKRKHTVDASATKSVSYANELFLDLPPKQNIEFDSSLICKEDYECPICSRLIYEPITTPCGHTFCRVCLDRCLDHMDTCPLCKFSLAHFIVNKHNVITKLLNWFLWTYLKEETSKRKTEYEEEMNDLKKIRFSTHRCDIPIFVCTVAMPTIPCSLHIFEPRYRLMVRRCLESGCKQFGMCPPSDDENKRYEDYGCMLEINDSKFLPDGRSLLETVGRMRFRVINRSMRDGYDTAFVEFIKDEPIEGPEMEDLKALQVDVYAKMQLWLDSIQAVQRATIINYYGNLPEMEASDHAGPSGPAWHWWALRVLPVHSHLQLKIMQKARPRDRLLAIRRILKAIPRQLYNQDAAHQANQDVANQDPANEDAANQEAANQDAVNQEAANQ